MKKNSKRIQTILSIMILVVFTTTFSFAATDPDWGSQTPQISVRTYSYNSTWKSAMDAAYHAWNATQTPVSINVNSSSPNRLYAGSYANSWYGTASSANPGPFTIKLNSRTISRDASDINKFIRSVLVHEYGHIFCLDHTTQTSIMNGSRDRNTMIIPQAYDISEVNTVY